MKVKGQEKTLVEWQPREAKESTITTKKILFSGGYFVNLWGFSPPAN